MDVLWVTNDGPAAALEFDEDFAGSHLGSDDGSLGSDFDGFAAHFVFEVELGWFGGPSGVDADEFDFGAFSHVFSSWWMGERD